MPLAIDTTSPVDERKREPFKWTAGKVATGLILGGLVGATALMCFRYKVSPPEKYLVRTGLGIKNLSISKTGIVWPFQKHTFIKLNPSTYQFNLHNMSKEKVEFNLPVVFTIGPISPLENEQGFKNYAQMLSDLSPAEVENIIRGVIEGETRGLTADMTIEEMFNSKERFKTEVVSKIDVDLSKLGLQVLNANIKEMSDYDDENKYFAYRKKRAIETANYDAQVEVAEARKKGEIGMKEREKDTRVTVAQLDTIANVSENERAAEISVSAAQLEEARALSRKRSELANVEATLSVKQREIELQSALEVQRQTQLLEQLRAEQLAATKVTVEQQVVEAQGKSSAIRLLADAHLYEEQKKAQAIEAVLLAHSNGMNSLLSSCGGDVSTAKFYLGLKEGLYEKLAHEQSQALQGLKPNISVWNTGSSAGDDPIGPILRSVQSLAPMLDGIHKHTDFKVPSWIVESNSTKSDAHDVKDHSYESNPLQKE